MSVQTGEEHSWAETSQHEGYSRAWKDSMLTARGEKVDRNGRDSLVHPGCGGLEPVDDLGVVYGKEDDADKADDERDVVPCAQVSTQQRNKTTETHITSPCGSSTST